MTGKIGTFHSGYGGVRVPIGTIVTDSGSLTAASAIQALDGSAFNGSTETAKFNAWAQAGYPGAKDASFYASSTPIVTMSSNTAPSGYTARASSEYNSSTYAWKAMDGSLSTYWQTATAVQSGWLELSHPAVIPFGYSLSSDNMGSHTYQTPAGLILESPTDSTSDFIQTAEYDTLSWTSGQTRNFTPSQLVNSMRTRLLCMGLANSANSLLAASFRIYGADLAVIKSTSHGFTTGAAVRVAAASGQTLPTGLSANTTYYIREGADANKFTLYDTAAHATAGGSTGLITLSDCGGGAFKVYPYPTITLSTAANGKLYF